ncbi:MAG: membrane protein insertion efficiency factor YidD [Gaiellaceae bacterium]
MTRIPVALIQLYRNTIGRMVGGRCKYHPSCSQYALDAYNEYGVLRGTVLTGWRLLRCNPLSHGGVDHARDQAVFGGR